jgi:hypothetical protein
MPAHAVMTPPPVTALMTGGSTRQTRREPGGRGRARTIGRQPAVIATVPVLSGLHLPPSI